MRQRRGFLLAYLVQAAVAAGDLERARGALADLDRQPELWETTATAAAVARARGELSLAKGDAAQAVVHLRKAIQGWRELSAPWRMAEVRLRLAAALEAAGDQEGAKLEIGAAETMYGEIGLERCPDAGRGGLEG